MRISPIIVTKKRPITPLAALESATRALPRDGEATILDGDPERAAELVMDTPLGRCPRGDVRCPPAPDGPQ